MAEIIVDTGILQSYARKLNTIGKKLKSIDNRIDTLYSLYGNVEIKKLSSENRLTKAANILQKKDYKYFSEVISTFEQTEKALSKFDPLNFRVPSSSIEGPVVKQIIKKAFKKYWSGVKKVVSIGIKLTTPSGIMEVGRAVVKKAGQITSTVINSYKEKGWAYKTVQYGKGAFKIIKGGIKVVKSVCAIVASGGALGPIEILSIISGVNDIYNGIMDIKATYNEEYDQIGRNALKEYLEENGGIIGSYLGSEKTGEIIGSIVYYGIDLIPTIASLDTSIDKIKQLNSTDLSEVGKELKEIGQFDVGKIMTTDIETLRYEAKLASYEFSATTNLLKNIGALAEVSDKAFDVGKELSNYHTIFDSDWKNPVISSYEKVTGAYGIAEKGTKFLIKAGTFVFD